MLTQSEAARLVRQMIDERPWKDEPWARMALAVAARAIERGRHLTKDEQNENLIRAMQSEDWEEDEPVKADTIAKMRHSCHKPFP